MASGAQIHADGQPYDPGTRRVSGAPAWLRWVRGVVGLLLLVATWGTSMLAIVLAFAVFGAQPHRQVLVRLALYAAGALGVLWLGVMALTCLIVGSFSLMLALTTRRW